VARGAVVQVEGRRQLAASMKQAGLNMGDLTAANREVAQLVSPAAASSAPRRSGQLAASLRPTASRAAARIASSVVYAGAIHFGWPARHIAPNPFAFTAAQHTEPRWTEAYNQRIEQILSKIKGV